MKKIAFFSFILGALAISCNKESVDNTTIPATGVISLTASVEDNTKATINGDDQVVWTEGDQICVRLYKGTAIGFVSPGVGLTYDDYQSWDAPFDLTAGAGTTKGTFSNDTQTGIPGVHWSFAAFYPKFDSNFGQEGEDVKVYFHLQEQYLNYTSGRFLTPLVADLNTDGLDKTPTNIIFRQTAGTIMIKLQNIPAGINKFGLSIAGKSIVGWDGGIIPADAGTAAITSLSGVAGAPVYFQFPASYSNTSEYVFYVPVPVVDAPVITAALYLNNDLAWSKTTTKTQPNVGRGTLLELGALDLDTVAPALATDYNQGKLPELADTWSIVGPAIGVDWDSDVDLYPIGTTNWYYVANQAMNGEFKFRKAHGWAVNRGLESEGSLDGEIGNEIAMKAGGGNASVSEGYYDVYFNPTEEKAFIYKR